MGRIEYAFMSAGPAAALLQLISSAVTPVVMISACASLALGANNKHASISDRVRASIVEYRLPTTSEDRRVQLLRQLRIFRRRFTFTWLAVVATYLAIASFTLTTLLILITQRGLSSGTGTIGLFVLGVVLMLVVALLEIGESSLSTRTLDIEMCDILETPHKTPRV